MIGGLYYNTRILVKLHKIPLKANMLGSSSLKARSLASVARRNLLQLRSNATVPSQAQETPATETPLPQPNEEYVNYLLNQFAKYSDTNSKPFFDGIPKPTLDREKLLAKKFELVKKALTLTIEDRYNNPEVYAAKALEKEAKENAQNGVTFKLLKKSASEEPYTKHELFLRRKFHEKQMSKLGSELSEIYKPHEDISNPPQPNQLTLKKLMASGAHLGHSVKLAKHTAQPFIYGKYKDIHIIDLEMTMSYLKRAAKVVESVAENAGVILFVGLRDGQEKSVKEAAKRAGGYYVVKKWIPGTITNALSSESGGSASNLHEIDMANIPTERVLLQKDFDVPIRPDLVVILNPGENDVIVKECRLTRIPTIGIVDTNTDPSCVTYPVPANDDSIRSTNLICGVLSRAAETGKNRRIELVSDYKFSRGMVSSAPIIVDTEIDEFADDEGEGGETSEDNLFLDDEPGHKDKGDVIPQAEDGLKTDDLLYGLDGLVSITKRNVDTLNGEHKGSIFGSSKDSSEEGVSQIKDNILLDPYEEKK